MAEAYEDRHKAPLPELEALLHTIGAQLATPVTAYLIGGCALSMRGLKDATKDADIIVRTAKERAAVRAVTGSGRPEVYAVKPPNRRDSGPDANQDAASLPMFYLCKTHIRFRAQ